MLSSLIGKSILADLTVWISYLWENNCRCPWFPRPSQPEPCHRVLFCPLIWDVRWMNRMVLPPSTITLTLWFCLKHFYIHSLTASIYTVFISPPPPSCSLSISFSLFSAQLCGVLMSGFLMPTWPICVCRLDLFSLSPWYLSLSFPFYWVELLFFLLFMGEVSSQACWGFFVWSAVLAVLFSFEGINTLYLNLTYPLLASHKERT